MSIKKFLSLFKCLEDPNNPLLGPTLKGLYLFGLWQTGSIYRTVAFNIVHIFSFLFVVCQAIDLHSVWHNINQVLNNMSIVVLSAVCVAKCNSYVFHQNQWQQLVKLISEEELSQIMKQDRVTMKHMKFYTRYTRILTYSYWVLVFLTNLFMIIKPFFKYASSNVYRDEIKSGIEPYPQIIPSWFPFDKTVMPGYLGAVIVHIIMSIQGSGIIGAYDMNAIAIMCYLKGQLKIVNEKCARIFEEITTTQALLEKIKDYNKHHNVLIKQYELFNALLSPTMFLYMLLCSLMICCSVVQFSSKNVTTSQQIWVVQFTSALIAQLFLFCWHSNEVTVESREVDRGVYNSKWWTGNTQIRKQLLLLACKLNYPFVLHAGPYTSLSLRTFIEVMKRSYSFYTLFSQMQGE